MRKFMMVAAAAAIALIGLSANMCGGDTSEQTTQPETQPTQPDQPAQ